MHPASKKMFDARMSCPYPWDAELPELGEESPQSQAVPIDVTRHTRRVDTGRVYRGKPDRGVLCRPEKVCSVCDASYFGDACPDPLGMHA